MPRTSQKAGARGSSQSQASQSSGSKRRRQQQEEEEDRHNAGSQSSQSQANSNWCLSGEERDRKVADFVRYLLFMDAKKVPVKRADISKNVMKEYGRSFGMVFAEAQKKMKKTFGYDLVEIEHNTQKAYILVNSLPAEARQIVRSDPDDNPKMGLLFVILAIIFMKDSVLTEDLMWQSLKWLGILKGKNHDRFGDVEKLITVDFVRQMYLDRRKVLTGDSMATFEYRWGARAQNELSKRSVLEMVAQVYGTDLEAWTAKYKEILEEEEV